MADRFQGRLFVRLRGHNARRVPAPAAGTHPEGHGTWRVDDRGACCIESVWGHSAPYNSNWCSIVYQAGENYFLTYASRPPARPLKLSIKK